MAGPGEQCFEGVLYELPSNYRHVMDVPQSVSEAFGSRRWVPVVGTADGIDLTATLVPRGGGRHRLFLNARVRDAAGKGPGDSVEIKVRFDPSDRIPDMPADLEAALRAEGSWPPGKRCALPAARSVWWPWPTPSDRRPGSGGSPGSSMSYSRKATIDCGAVTVPQLADIWGKRSMKSIRILPQDLAIL